MLAGWFQWEKIHQLERAALPEYFNGKDTKKSPEMYIEQRTCIMKKYRENPQKLLKFENVQDLVSGDLSGASRVFGFLDHWGLINYQAITMQPVHAVAIWAFLFLEVDGRLTSFLPPGLRTKRGGVTKNKQPQTGANIRG